MTQSHTAYQVYFAGSLFDHKQLTGNALLAAAVAQVSAGRYRCLLPQDLEHPEGRAMDIRDQDLYQVLAADLAVFNFDGAELDAGTVVEFVFAKCLDIPAVILRSDFRAAGDQAPGGESWNLMCSFFPRTRTVSFNAMAWYRQARTGGADLEQALARFHRRVAAELVENLDVVGKEPPLTGEGLSAEVLYRWALRFPGGGLEALGKDDFAERLVAAKRARGLVP